LPELISSIETFCCLSFNISVALGAPTKIAFLAIAKLFPKASVDLLLLVRNSPAIHFVRYLSYTSMRPAFNVSSLNSNAPESKVVGSPVRVLLLI
jgi:hypothetical protein